MEVLKYLGAGGDGNESNNRLNNSGGCTIPVGGNIGTMCLSSRRGNGKPSRDFPYGVNKFMITGLAAGGSVTVSITFPKAVPTTAQYFKVDASGQWTETSFGSNDGDNRITMTLTDGDPLTDADGALNGIIDDPGAITVSTTAQDTTGSSSSGSSSGCFISNLFR